MKRELWKSLNDRDNKQNRRKHDLFELPASMKSEPDETSEDS